MKSNTITLSETLYDIGEVLFGDNELIILVPEAVRKIWPYTITLTLPFYSSAIVLETSTPYAKVSKNEKLANWVVVGDARQTDVKRFTFQAYVTAIKVAFYAEEDVSCRVDGGSLQGPGTVDPGTITTVTDKQIIEAWLTERTAWTADEMVDFTVSEPLLTSSNIGKIYLNTKTGAGSASTTLTFDKDDLYFVHDDLTWKEYRPKDNWLLTIGGDSYIYYNGGWVQNVKRDHMHPIVGNTLDNTYFRIAGGKLWQNITDNPPPNLRPGDAAWADNWKEFKASASNLPDAAGLPNESIPIVKDKNWAFMLMPDWFNISTVETGSTLKTGEYSKAEPPANTTYKLTPPAASKDTWFGVINTGDGVIEVRGVKIAARGIAFWSSNVAGDDWVFIYGDMEVPDRVSDGITTFIVRDGKFFKMKDN